MKRTTFAVVASLLGGLSGLDLANAEPAPSARTWTLQDIVQAPRVLETAISPDGRTAYYIVRRDVLATNKREFTLFRVDIPTGNVQKVLTSPWISRILPIPGTREWSVLADISGAVELYRVEGARMRPLKIGASVVTIGAETPEAIAEVQEQDQVFGVFDYGWAPDGTAFWYTTARRLPAEPNAIEITDHPRVTILNYPPSESQLHVVNRGHDHMVAAAKGQLDPLPYIVYWNGAAKWTRTQSGRLALAYSRFDLDTSGNGTFVPMQYDLDATRSTPGVAVHELSLMGPNGGELSIQGAWRARHLIETVSGGRTIDFGPAAFSLNTYWASGNWQFPESNAAVVAVRYSGPNLRSGLVKLERDGNAIDLDRSVGLTNCVFSTQSGQGICIRQGINVPSEVVRVDVGKWTETKLTDIDPAYAAIAPLKVEPVAWNVDELQSSGFVVYPRNFKAGQHYPAILLTHGVDGDNSFVNADFQWSYPAQVWAERGYFVLYVNDIPVGTSADRQVAYQQWISGSGPLTGQEASNLIWLSQLKIYVAALHQLNDEGKVDLNRVGMAGYSRGSQMVSIAVTQTDLFKAASMGDGGYFAPSAYWMGDNSLGYKMFFGGYPNNEGTVRNWQELAPVFRADKVRTAVLFQNAKYNFGKVDFYYALRDASVPAETALFKSETHGFHRPVNRLTAMTQNLDWFDFWLQGKEDPDPAKAEQYKRWEAMRAKQQANSTAAPTH